MHSNYNPDKDPNIKGNPYKTIFVGRLHLETKEETLKKTFEKFGKISELRLVRDKVTGYSRGYAFITFERSYAFRHAYLDAHHLIIDGRQIIVDFERERICEGWIPRRLGGGLGGRKESGQLRFGGREKPFNKPINQPIPDNAFSRFNERRGTDAFEGKTYISREQRKKERKERRRRKKREKHL